MATELARFKSIKATSSLTTKQFCFVKLDSNGQIVLCGNGQYAIGVLQDKPAAGDPGAVCFPGDITKLVLGGTVTAGQDLQSDGNGAAVAAVTGSFVIGQALAGGSSGAIITALYQPKASKL